MSTKDDTSSLDQPTNGQSLVVPRTAPVAAKDGEWTTVAAMPRDVAAHHVDPSAYLHAARRHWLLGTLLGVILGGICAVSLWFMLPVHYTATSWVQVRMREESFGAPKTGYNNQQEFETYKGTQRELLKNPYVLTTALRKPEISNLGMIQREKPNEIVWLSDQLSVDFPGNAEVMQISLTDYDPKEVTKLVNAVVAAYLEEVVGNERKQRNEKYSKVNDTYREKEDQTREKRALLAQLAEQLKTTDKENISIQQRVALERAAESRRQLTALQTQLSTLKADLSVAQEALKRIDQDPAPELELQQLVQKDEICRGFQQMIAPLEQAAAEQERVSIPGVSSSHGSQFRQKLETVKAQYDARVAQLAELIKGGKRAEVGANAAELTLRVSLQEAEEAELKKRVEKDNEDVNQILKSYVDVDMAQSELVALERQVESLWKEKEDLLIDLRAQARVVPLRSADEPVMYDNPQVKIALSAVGGLTGLVLPMCGIIWWDVRKRRINSSEEVAKGLGVPVIGSVPVIPGRVIRRLNAPGAKNQQWNVRLTESIDSIAAKLLRDAAIDQTRVVLITSAVSGEGKTTLATQVAMSLARAGRRTVLVDFDLRRPAIDKAFQLPLHPGVSEALCGESEILDLIQPTGTKNLSVVTAGRCDRHALQALASGVDERLFEELRAEYEFVVVDGSPILPVADSRYVSQHVDAVVLSIFRDFSRAPKVVAACEILESFGVRDVEAVVTSASEGGYGVVEM